MPVIIEDEKRVAACQEISKNLDLVAQLNEALSALEHAVPTLLLQPEKGKPIKFELAAGPESNVITELLLKRKAELVRIIRRDTSKHRIALSDSEESSLSMPEKESKVKKPAADKKKEE